MDYGPLVPELQPQAKHGTGKAGQGGFDEIEGAPDLVENTELAVTAAFVKTECRHCREQFLGERNRNRSVSGSQLLVDEVIKGQAITVVDIEQERGSEQFPVVTLAFSQLCKPFNDPGNRQLHQIVPRHGLVGSGNFSIQFNAILAERVGKSRLCRHLKKVALGGCQH